ncbi:MAG: CehA/McbA family metallohydrolase [Bacteroidia bacterium]|nr:CehA/McbA family metallohydrolase [Bacteroidia bacterium]
MRNLLFTACILIFVFGNEVSAQNITVDGAKKYQTIHGLGVNINPQSWNVNSESVKSVIDSLITGMGCTNFRLIFDDCDWEAVNDNNDPNSYNWTYYDSLYTAPRFTCVWNTIYYLNSKGITDITLSPDGAASGWMGGTKLNQGAEAEYAEMMASMVYYGQKRRSPAIQFSMLSPINETTCGGSEAPVMSSNQLGIIFSDIAAHFINEGITNVTLIGPDDCGGWPSSFHAMITNTTTMSEVKFFGGHQYGNSTSTSQGLIDSVKNSAYPDKGVIMTEANEVCNGFKCDGGIYNPDYGFTNYAGPAYKDILQHLNVGVNGIQIWEGYDSRYHHPNRYLTWSMWGIFAVNDTLHPDVYNKRAHFYVFKQLYNFVKPGFQRIDISTNLPDMTVSAFYNPANATTVITGKNDSGSDQTIEGVLKNLSEVSTLKYYYTNALHNFSRGPDVPVTSQTFSHKIPAFSVFTLVGNNKKDSEVALAVGKPEPNDWYAGDMHIHRNCGEGTSTLSESEFTAMMEPNDLAVISVLADMGDGEVKDSKTDLPKVNGTDAVQSIPGRTVHWDAEWHFDPAGTTFENKALGGHIVLLGLSEAHYIWDESPYKILAYGRSQHAIVGFCHMQYLKDSIPGTLDCCTPIDFPVEAALGTIDFLAEDVWLNDAAVNAYYKLLNCGFRLGWAAGTDFPCNNSQPFGTLLTYVQVKNKPFSYRQWVEGIKNGRSVVTTNGHHEFLDLKVNGNATPGDEIRVEDKGTLDTEVIWTSVLEQTGRIELVLNGNVVATQEGTAKQGEPVILKASIPIQKSSWLCARRMDEKGHRLHTAPVYITLKNAPVRASTEDARYFIKWIDKTLINTAPGGPWNKYFTHDLDVVQNRYRQARRVYEEIAMEATKEHKR